MQQTASKGPDNTNIFRELLSNTTTQNKIDIFRGLLPNITYFFHIRCTRQYFFFSVVNLFLIFIDRDKCKEYLQKSLCIEKVKNNIVYCWDIYYFLWLQASAFLK